MIMKATEVDVGGVVAREDHPVHTGRLPWMVQDVTVLHRGDGRRSEEEDTGDEAGVDEEVVEADLYDHALILDHAVDLRAGAGPVHHLVDQCHEHRRDVQVVAEEEGEAMEDGIRHHAGVEGAVAVEEGDEALATVPTTVLVLATVAGAEIVDETPTVGLFEDGNRLQAPFPGHPLHSSGRELALLQHAAGRYVSPTRPC